MKLIDKEWNTYQQKHTNTWLADTAGEITADHDPEGAAGSMVIVIEAGCTYIKNTAGKWQKYGSTEVI